jgi:hypothetical protein
MILYNFITQKKVNGTLFYCFEYFIFLNKFKYTEFWIYDISEKDFNYIIEIFKNRYDFDHKLLKQIKIFHIKDALKAPEKVIILDNRTYENLRLFFPNSQVLWQKTEGGHNFRDTKTHENDITFGSYSYQKYEVHQHLQFHFDIYKKIEKSENKIFISSLSITDEQTKNYLRSYNILYNENKIFFKDNNKHHKNLFENFNVLLYVKNYNLDTNNRLIVESYFYDKIIILVDKEQNDSAFLRLKKLNEYGIDPFVLTKDNKLIQEYLDDSK